MNLLFRDAWKAITQNFPTASLTEDAGLSTVFAGLPLFFFNASVRTAPIQSLAEFEEVLKQAQQRAEGFPHSWFHLVCHEGAPTGWEEAAPANGFVPAMLLTGMETSAITPPKHAPSGVEFREVKDEGGYRDVAEINALAYGMPLETADCFATGDMWQPDSTYGAVAYKDGQRVSCAAALIVSGTIYIALVATVPEQRGKGYADLVMRHVIDESLRRTGLTRITLHATEAGKPVYEKMGFRSQGDFTILLFGAH